jgi:hypothetical protein
MTQKKSSFGQDDLYMLNILRNVTNTVATGEQSQSSSSAFSQEGIG